MIDNTAGDPPRDNNKDADNDHEDNLTHSDVCLGDKIVLIKHLGRSENTNLKCEP